MEGRGAASGALRLVGRSGVPLGGWGLRQGFGCADLGWAPGDRLQATALRGPKTTRLRVAPPRGRGHRRGSGPGVAQALRPTDLGRSACSRTGRASPAQLGGLLPRLPPLVIAVVLEQPVDPLLHPAAQPGGIQTTRPQAPETQPGSLGAGQTRPGPGAGHAIHQFTAAAHPAVEALIDGFRAAAPGSTAIPGCASAAIPGRTGAQRLLERSRTAGRPDPCIIRRWIGTALRQPIPTIPGLIHGARLPAAARQPTLPAQAQQGNGEPTPLQCPEKGGHGRACNAPTLREPALRTGAVPGEAEEGLGIACVRPNCDPVAGSRSRVSCCPRPALPTCRHPSDQGPARRQGSEGRSRAGGVQAAPDSNTSRQLASQRPPWKRSQQVRQARPRRRRRYGEV